MSGSLARAVVVAALASLLFAGQEQAGAERSGRAGVIVSFDGSIAPRHLPRDRSVPVSVTLAGTIRGSEGSPPPRLTGIEIAFGARDGLSTAGLPRCPRALLGASDGRHALAACGTALVGRGHAIARLDFPGQRPTDVLARLFAFNGRTAAGHPAIWVLAYPDDPPLPASFVLPVYLQRLDFGAYGVLLRAALSQALGRWWSLRFFQITFGRRYRARGTLHSYLSAPCPLPPRFSIGIFPLARATYQFAPGPTLSTTILRGCRVRQ